MATEGLSNREIAEALFLTRRTVEMHLTGAYRKLDVAGRQQLPAALAGSRRTTGPGEPLAQRGGRLDPGVEEE